MSMVLLLNNVDTATCIIAQIDSNHTLAALARTSHALSEIALDRLWYSIENITVLARCMPSQYWAEVNTQTHGRRMRSSQLTLFDTIRVDDWLGLRFRQYAARIRSLNVAPQERYIPQLGGKPPGVFARLPLRSVTSVHSEILEAWRVYDRDIAVLFPNLMRVTWMGHKTQDVNLIGLFLVPSLVSLHLHTASRKFAAGLPIPPDLFTTNDAATILRKTMLSCPLLHSLELRGDHISMPLLDSDPLMVMRIQSLKKWSCSEPVPRDWIRHLAIAPRLTVLQLALHPGTQVPAVPEAFPTLRQLCLRHITWELACAWIAILHTTRLQSLELYLIPIRDTRLWAVHVEKLYCIIGNHLSTRNLKQLILDRGWVWGTPPSSRGLRSSASSASIGNALSLSKLEHVVLHEPFINAGSSLVSDMLQAWPNIHTLRVEGADSLPLDKFLDLIHEHPSIKVLDAVKVSIDPTIPLPVPRASHYDGIEYFRFFVIDDQPANILLDMRHIAYYLVNTFPFAAHQPPNMREWNLSRTDQVAAEVTTIRHHERRTGIKLGLSDYEKIVMERLGGYYVIPQRSSDEPQ